MVAPVRLQFDALKDVQECHTANLSTGGMFVAAKSPRPVGTLLRFELDVGTGEPIKGLGEVVWMRPHSLGPEAPSGFGVQFGHLDEPDRERLQAAVHAALEDLGVEGLSEPVRRAVIDRPSGLEAAPSGAGTTETRESRSTAEPPSARAPRATKKNRAQAGRSARTVKKGAQPSHLEISGRTKVLIVILGLLLLMLLFMT